MKEEYTIDGLNERVDELKKYCLRLSLKINRFFEIEISTEKERKSKFSEVFSCNSSIKVSSYSKE